MISRTDRGGTLQSDLAVVSSKTSAKMRLGGVDSREVKERRVTRTILTIKKR